ncbi:hypothetical protein LX32DRAFT_10504 [Colletotrichum zoysiae]|uniref:Uncharacterized protein n=1 Tax=Colletotrichum zoysiae TaxID=1216348 RepID=A0AAD9M2D1_9PEZI|nr:hypothetical protein LX32DRAFT_10504 [Colletotrichum zoysiae]
MGGDAEPSRTATPWAILHPGRGKTEKGVCQLSHGHGLFTLAPPSAFITISINYVIYAIYAATLGSSTLCMVQTRDQTTLGPTLSLSLSLTPSLFCILSCLRSSTLSFLFTSWRPSYPLTLDMPEKTKLRKTRPHIQTHTH